MRNKVITAFCIIWLLVFNYESLRGMVLNPLFGRALPKVKFLFPPAGWIMFYNLGEGFGFADVYGLKDGQAQRIDPHDILQTRPIAYDNIHRNALISVLEPGMQSIFCAFLRYKFPQYDTFDVVYVNYPSVTKTPQLREEGVAYVCP